MTEIEARFSPRIDSIIPHLVYPSQKLVYAKFKNYHPEKQFMIEVNINNGNCEVYLHHIPSLLTTVIYRFDGEFIFPEMMKVDSYHYILEELANRNIPYCELLKHLLYLSIHYRF